MERKTQPTFAGASYSHITQGIKKQMAKKKKPSIIDLDDDNEDKLPAEFNDIEDTFNDYEEPIDGEPSYIQTEELEYIAEVMTYLIEAVNPLIDKGTTYEIMLQAMSSGMTVGDAKRYGAMIHQTTFTPKSSKNNTTH